MRWFVIPFIVLSLFFCLYVCNHHCKELVQSPPARRAIASEGSERSHTLVEELFHDIDIPNWLDDEDVLIEFVSLALLIKHTVVNTDLHMGKYYFSRTNPTLYIQLQMFMCVCVWYIASSKSFCVFVIKGKTVGF